MTFGYSMPTKSPLEDLRDYIDGNEREKAQQAEYRNRENQRIMNERKQLEEKVEWLQKLLSKMVLR